MFESNVILDRYKTTNSKKASINSFESNVILDRYKTTYTFHYLHLQFESNVILDRYKTDDFNIEYGLSV